MKRRQNISKHLLQVSLGLLVGIFVLSQSLYIEREAEQDAQEQSDEKAPESVQVVSSEAVTSSSFQVNLGFQSYLLEEIAQTEMDQKKTLFQENLLLSVSKTLKVVLSQIIAPNAP